MKKIQRWGLVLTGMGFLAMGHLHAAVGVKVKKTAQVRNQVHKKMQDIYPVLVEMMTDTISDQRFSAPENRVRIERNAKTLADRAHELAQVDLSANVDPTVKIFSELFQGEAQRAYSALKSGNRSYARGILLQISTYYIYAQDAADSHLTSIPLEPKGKGLSELEQGRFYAATGQYDRALELFHKIVKDEAVLVKQPFAWEQAVRYGLSIAVRVKKDPAQALVLVEQVMGAEKAAFFVKQDALKWKESIAQWKEEILKRALTETGLYAEAMQLIAKARELQKYPMDHGADVLYLRATAVVHELMQAYPDGVHAQEALLMAGMCYDVLRPLKLEDLHEIYYEACIKKVPHSQTAEVCYRRYEQSTYEGYTGSAGTFLPDDVKLKLQKLEAIAHPKVSSPN